MPHLPYTKSIMFKYENVKLIEKDIPNFLVSDFNITCKGMPRFVDPLYQWYDLWKGVRVHFVTLFFVTASEFLDGNFINISTQKMSRICHGTDGANVLTFVFSTVSVIQVSGKWRLSFCFIAV